MISEYVLMAFSGIVVGVIFAIVFYWIERGIKEWQSQ